MDAGSDRECVPGLTAPVSTEGMMATYGRLRRLWLTRFSQPAAERVIHRHVLRTGPARVLELGLGLLVRTERMLTAAASRPAPTPVHYVGLDRFEGRAAGDPPGVSLKQAHQRLHKLAKVQLVPGNVDTSLARVCNHLGTFDLVLVSADTDERHLERCWFFLQRVVTPATTIFVQPQATAAWTTITKARVDELAAKTVQPALRRAG
jgi:hypothetical protein